MVLVSVGKSLKHCLNSLRQLNEFGKAWLNKRVVQNQVPLLGQSRFQFFLKCTNSIRNALLYHLTMMHVNPEVGS
jgi:hypothetical protein